MQTTRVTKVVRTLGIKGDRQIGWAEVVPGEILVRSWTPVSAGYAYQVRCSANVALREAQSWYRVVEEIS